MNPRTTTSGRRVAVITGANKGVGFGIVRALCKQFDGDVILTARNVDRGQQAVADLNQEGLRPRFHQLDITDTDSVDALATFLKDNYDGLDVLVNNAAIKFRREAGVPFPRRIKETVGCNFFGTLSVTRRLWPLLRPHARVVNVTCFCISSIITEFSQDLLCQLLKPDLTMAQLELLLQDYVRKGEMGGHFRVGWPTDAEYDVSKVGVCLMSAILSREAVDDSRGDIVVNACCPGHVRTDMSRYEGSLTVDQGADTPMYLSLLPRNAARPRGQFLAERTVVKWW
ncbi:carbonyl reductase [NADPH] 3-like [Haliotis rufescens]|uniref:carbonyl reductase [NADPH] 3-like n=1 Tax=Haliotis rufescens TaxID=6454 RepID=UPI00201F5D98|nr:carbonyl reductase [NADPH] 3-like [Haliotis rufescens]